MNDIEALWISIQQLEAETTDLAARLDKLTERVDELEKAQGWHYMVRHPNSEHNSNIHPADLNTEPAQDIDLMIAALANAIEYEVRENPSWFSAVLEHLRQFAAEVRREVPR